MNTQNFALVIPIILSGGSRARFWPLSGAPKPKQFLKPGKFSLIQQAALRCKSSVFDTRPIIVGADYHRYLIAEDLLEIDIEADILLEPIGRNSCAAITAGCLKALERSSDAIVMILGTDHDIPNHHQFCAAVEVAIPDARAGFLTTFGVSPSNPATRYGYILPGEQIRDGGCFLVNQFVEKPTQAQAEHYVREGYLWNSGSFLFRAKSFIDELNFHEPELLNAVKTAFDRAKKDLDFLRLEEQAFKRAPSISVDNAVMERTDIAAVLPVDYK